MGANLEVIEAEVLNLSMIDRNHLLTRLVASLETDPEVEMEWQLLAEQREQELADGVATVIAGEDAIKQLRARLVR